MDTQKAIELIEKSGHAAIVLPREADLDLLVSAEVIAALIERKGKKVGFLPTEFSLPEKLSHSKFFSKINGGGSLPKEFIVSLDISRSPISQLRYEKNDSFLHIILSPQSSPIQKEHISFLDGKIKCDCAILLGIENTEALSGSAGASPEFFSETPIINLDNSENNKNFGEANLVNSQRSSVSEITYELVTALGGGPLEPKEATLILAGILQKNDSLRSPKISPDTLLATSELMRLGAERAAAEELISENTPLNLLQFFGRASVRSKVDDKKGVLWSFITSDDFEKTGRSPKDLPRVLEYLEREAPHQKLTALLWQNPSSKDISVLVAGDKKMLEVLKSSDGGEFQSPHLALEKKFENFIEAEKHITSLLEGVL